MVLSMIGEVVIPCTGIISHGEEQLTNVLKKETGEEEVGYKDGLGNCTHVGIYCGNDIVRDSTRSTKTGRNGVGTRTIKGFNRVTLFSGLDYSVTSSYNASIEKVMAIIDSIHNQLIDLEGTLNELFRG